jgi:hypothetical protein
MERPPPRVLQIFCKAERGERSQVEALRLAVDETEVYRDSMSIRAII